MAKLSTRLKVRLIVPLTLLALVVGEEMVTYQVRRACADPYVRTAGIVACYGVGFAVVGNRLGPYMQRMLAQGHKLTRKEGGTLGVVAFFAVAYGLIYLLFFVMETRGVKALMPAAYR